MIKFESESFYLTSNVKNMMVGLSYGATIISTSAIIGFGGLAGWLGYSAFLLPFFMLMTIYLSTNYIGPKVYKLNKELNAKTFIELISRYYDSVLMRKILAFMTVILIPFYCTAVIIGVGKFIESTIGLNYLMSLTVFSLIVFTTIFYGGMKTIVKNDTILGLIILAGSIVVLLYTIFNHIIPINYLDSLRMAFDNSENKMIGFSKSIGFTGFTDFPDFLSKGWLFEFSLLCLTIPVGLIALPQLQTRFMLSKSEESFKKIAPYGVVIPFVVIGSFFIAGISSNAYYYTNYSQTAVQYAGSIDNIIPQWINDGYPSWMGIVLFVTILAAAFTTLNSLMHLLSTTVSNDLLKKENKNMGIISMLMVIFFAVLMSIIYENQPAFISRSTAVYFSLLGGSMLPSLIAMIRGQQNTNAAIWSIILGSLTSLFWLFFVHFKESKLFTGITIDLGKINFVETIVPTLLVSFLTYFIFSKIKQNV